MRMIPHGPPGSVLICGSRTWPHPDVVYTICSRLHDRHGSQLRFTEGGAAGADQDCHDWSAAHGLPPGLQHFCCPPDYRRDGRLAPLVRNTQMLLMPQWRTIACHHDFSVDSGGTSDMCIRSLLSGIPAWLVAGPDLEQDRRLLTLSDFPRKRIRGIRHHLTRLLSGNTIEAPRSASRHPRVRNRSS